MPAAVKLLAVEIENEMAFGIALCGSPSGVQVPRSQIITVPPPYSPSGMVPSKVLYSIGMILDVNGETFFVGIEARARASTAQLFITPSSSRRRS